VQPKPDFLGPQAAAAFQDPSVVRAYRHRPTYPHAALDFLAGLITDGPRAVLDVGCGTGALARPLAPLVDRVDAVDVSAAMVAEGRRLPRGDHPHLTWLVGRVEEIPLHPPYALIIAGDSLHWLDWDVALPRFATLLSPHGYLAILGVEVQPAPWEDALRPIRRRYGTIPNWGPYDHVAAVEERGLFHRAGTWSTGPNPFAQSLDDYVESFHGRAPFSRERMTPEAAAAFDAEVRALVAQFCPQAVELQVVTRIVWGTPGAALPTG
jgi:SAM-dependent methyltransferase